MDTNQSMGKCPVMHGKPTAARFSTRANNDWWPNQLNLRILSQQSAKSNPMDPGFSYAEAFKKLDLQALKNDIFALVPPRARIASRRKNPGLITAIWTRRAACCGR